MKMAVVWWMFTDVSEVLGASIVRALVDAASTCETSVNFYQTAWRYNPKHSHFHDQYMLDDTKPTTAAYDICMKIIMVEE
jgi:hypothetical protein